MTRLAVGSESRKRIDRRKYLINSRVTHPYQPFYQIDHIILFCYFFHFLSRISLSLQQYFRLATARVQCTICVNRLCQRLWNATNESVKSMRVHITNQRLRNCINIHNRKMLQPCSFQYFAWDIRREYWKEIS